MRIQLIATVALLALATPAMPEDKPKADDELAKLTGTWRVVSVSGHGSVRAVIREKGHDGLPLPGFMFTIDADKLTTENEWLVYPEPLREVTPGGKVMFGQEYATKRYSLQLPKAKGTGPAAVDVIIGKDVVLKGIYELKGDDLKVCVVNRLYCADRDEAVMAKKAASTERPTDYQTRNGGKTVSFVLKREKK